MTSDDFRWFSTYLSTMSDDFYLITSDFWESFWTCLPTLKSEVINGRSLYNLFFQLALILVKSSKSILIEILFEVFTKRSSSSQYTVRIYLHIDYQCAFSGARTHASALITFFKEIVNFNLLD